MTLYMVQLLMVNVLFLIGQFVNLPKTPYCERLFKRALFNIVFGFSAANVAIFLQSNYLFAFVLIGTILMTVYYAINMTKETNKTLEV